jgi:invasion protein IalB
MIARILLATLLMFAETSATFAQRQIQRERPRGFPAEKFSTQPVQPQMNVAPARLSPAANPERRPVVESPWVKFCGTDQNDPDAKVTCLTAKEVHLDRDARPFVAGVALIEAAGDDNKILRVTLPDHPRRPMQVRLRVDDDVARNGELRQCGADKCFWDFSANAALVARLKGGSRLHIEGVAGSDEITSYDLPLGEFARANEGAPTDPSSFKDEQERRWEERSRIR